VDPARRWSHFQPPLLRWSPDETRLFFGSPLRAWTVGQPAAGGAGALGEAVVVDLSGDGTVALAASGDRELEAVEVASGRPLGRIRNSREFSCAALSLDGRTVATGDFEHDVKLWDLSAAGAPLPAWQRRGRVGLAAVCDDPDRAVTRAGASVEIWDTATGCKVDPEDHPGPDSLLRRGVPLLEPGVRGEVIARLAAQAGDGQSRDSRGSAGSGRGIRGLFRELLTRLRNRGGHWEDGEMSYGPEALPFGVFAFSPAGKRAVSAAGSMVKTADREEPQASLDPAWDAPLAVWELETHRKTASLRGHTMPVTCADLTGDGALALTGSAGRVLRLWDLDAGRCLRVLKGHRGLVFSCGLTDDGRLAVSGSEDMTLRLWDLREGKLLFIFSAASAVTACDISRDGATVVAAEASGRVHVFFVEGIGFR
jgi:WD40 repeat protein